MPTTNHLNSKEFYWFFILEIGLLGFVWKLLFGCWNLIHYSSCRYGIKDSSTLKEDILG